MGGVLENNNNSTKIYFIMMKVLFVIGFCSSISYQVYGATIPDYCNQIPPNVRNNNPACAIAAGVDPTWCDTIPEADRSYNPYCNKVVISSSSIPEYCNTIPPEVRNNDPNCAIAAGEKPTWCETIPLPYRSHNPLCV